MAIENCDNKVSSSVTDLRSGVSWEDGFGVPIRGVDEGVFGD